MKKTSFSTRTRRFLYLAIPAALLLILAVSAAFFAVHTKPAPAPESPVSESSAPRAEAPAPYDFSAPVPESAAVDKSYFDDAVFLGDSRTEDFILYAGLANTNAYARMGMNVKTAFTEPVIALGGKNYTVVDALAQTQFSKVYMMFGVNELGWTYPKIFIQKYGELIDAARKINPNAIIYVQPILPVTKNHRDGDENNDRIQTFNTMIRRMAAEKRAYFINTSAAVADAEGFLPDDAASDGVHLNKKYCLKWLAYLQTHIVANAAS